MRNTFSTLQTTKSAQKHCKFGAFVLYLYYIVYIGAINMVTLQTRISDELKAQADNLFKDMGLSTTDAVRLFLTQCVNQGGLPFQPTGKQPNRYTLEALNEDGGKSYQSVEELAELWK